jgi:hypothetical protein
MSALKVFTNLDLQIPATSDNHAPQWKQVRDYVDGFRYQIVRAIMTDHFDAAYNSTDLTLTQTTPGAFVVDDIPLAVGNRVGIAGQPDETQNGIYIVTDLGDGITTPVILTRAADFDTSAAVKNNGIIPINEGTVNGGTNWRVTVGALPFVLDAVTISISKITADTDKVLQMAYLMEGDATTTVYTLPHNLDTFNIISEVFDDASGETVLTPPLKRVDANTVSITFPQPLGIGTDLMLVIQTEVKAA